MPDHATPPPPSPLGSSSHPSPPLPFTLPLTDCSAPPPFTEIFFFKRERVDRGGMELKISLHLSPTSPHCASLDFTTLEDLCAAELIFLPPPCTLALHTEEIIGSAK